MLDKHLGEWRNWGLSQKPRLRKTFTDGQNHFTGLIQSGEHDYILKVFNHSFDQAVTAQRWASSIGIAPAVSFAKDNLAVFEYEADVLHQRDDVQQVNIEKIAAALTTLHQQPHKNVECLGYFDLLKFCDEYLATTDIQTHNWHQALMPALEIFINDPTPWCFCHNDLVKENCVIQAERALFIDWEFAQRHNPWFDLAAIVVYFRLSDAQSTALLKCYYQNWQDKIQQPIFYAAQIAVLWGDLLWNLSRSGMDYRHHNEYRFKELITLALKLNIHLPDD